MQNLQLAMEELAGPSSATALFDLLLVPPTNENPDLCELYVMPCAMVYCCYCYRRCCGPKPGRWGPVAGAAESGTAPYGWQREIERVLEYV